MTDGHCAQSSVDYITQNRHTSFIILHYVQTDICLLQGIVRQTDIVLRVLGLYYTRQTFFLYNITPCTDRHLFAAGNNTTDGHCAQSSVVYITLDRRSSFIILHHVQTDICLLWGIVRQTDIVLRGPWFILHHADILPLYYTMYRQTFVCDRRTLCSRVLWFIFPRGDPGLKSRMFPPYPNACRKRRLKWVAVI